MENYIVDIENSDRAVGWMVRQILSSAGEKKWYVAMASLFMLVEQVLRCVADAEDDQRLEEIIDSIFSQKMIDDSEKQTLHSMRIYRNKYMHSNFHANAFEIEGLSYPVSEAETAEKIFDLLNQPLLEITAKLLKK